MSRGRPPEQWKAAPLQTQAAAKEIKDSAGYDPPLLEPESLFPFRCDGFDHELIDRIGSLSLVARSMCDHQLHYEVAILQRHEARHWPNGIFTPAGLERLDSALAAPGRHARTEAAKNS